MGTRRDQHPAASVKCKLSCCHHMPRFENFIKILEHGGVFIFSARVFIFGPRIFNCYNVLYLSYSILLTYVSFLYFRSVGISIQDVIKLVCSIYRNHVQNLEEVDIFDHAACPSRQCRFLPSFLCVSDVV